jgi:hypothetical protein
VAIFGRFKAGKSSFINDLIGENLFPTGVLPVTAILTSIQYGSETKFEVIFRDSRRINISQNELPSFITEKENPLNHKGVHEVHVEHPNLQKYSGIVFIDTPGLGSVFAHNTRLSLESLPKVQKALVAIAVDPPLSEQDLNLIREIQRFTPEFSILITKADLMNADQRKEIELFIKHEVQKNLNLSPKIFFYSIQEEHKNLREIIDSQLILPLIENKKNILDKIAVHKMKTLKTDVQQYLNLIKASAEKTSTEIKEISNRVLREEENTEFLKRELSSIQRTLVTNTRELIQKDLFTNYTEILQNISKNLNRSL